MCLLKVYDCAGEMQCIHYIHGFPSKRIFYLKKKRLNIDR